MFKVSGRSALTALTMILCVVGVVLFALNQLIPDPPRRITIAAGSQGGAFEFYAQKYREILARSHVTLDVRFTDGTGENLKLISEPGSGVDVAFVQAGVTNSQQAPNLESLGRIDYLVFFVFCRSADSFSDLTELKGKRIAVGPAGSGTNVVATRILSASGINIQSATLLPLAGQQAVDALHANHADVLILGNVLDAPLVQSLLRDPEVRLVSLPRAKALARRFPFLTRLELPAGVIDFQDNIPAIDTSLIGTTVSVLVRSDVHPEIVGLLARALEEVHRDPGLLHQYGEFPTQTDPDFPMAESASDYYKNGPSFLHRYLPFWVVSYAKRLIAILVTVIAIVVPLFSYAPKLYLWVLRRHLSKVYRDLRLLEARLTPGMPTEDLADCRRALSEIDKEAAILPMRHSDLFFELKEQIEATRSRIDSDWQSRNVEALEKLAGPKSNRRD
jgi:TRAP transporter TAXI family solute receptor